MNRVVGLGEWVCSNNEAETIVTYGLSSCVAVAVYCPIQKVAGLIHIVLPTPYSEKDVNTRPGHFATTAVPLLIRKMMEKYGCLKENLRIHLYGGANSRKGDSFQIGSRNLEQVNKMLRSLNVRARKSEVGGHFSRSVAMSVKTGEIELSTLPLNF